MTPEERQALADRIICQELEGLEAGALCTECLDGTPLPHLLKPDAHLAQLEAERELADTIDAEHVSQLAAIIEAARMATTPEEVQRFLMLCPDGSDVAQAAAEIARTALGLGLYG